MRQCRKMGNFEQFCLLMTLKIPRSFSVTSNTWLLRTERQKFLRLPLQYDRAYKMPFAIEAVVDTNQGMPNDELKMASRAMYFIDQCMQEDVEEFCRRLLSTITIRVSSSRSRGRLVNVCM